MDERSTPKRLGERLVAAGALTSEQLEEALTRQRDSWQRLGELLQAAGLVSSEALISALSQHLNMEVIDLTQSPPDDAALNLIPPELIRLVEVLPLRRRGATLRVAAVDPADGHALERVRQASGHQTLEVVAATAHQLHAYLKTAFELSPTLASPPNPVRLEPAVTPTAAAETPGQAAHDLVAHTLDHAISRRADAALLSTAGGSGWVRLRVDGVLHTLLSAPPRLIWGAISVLGELASDGGLIDARAEGATGRFKLATLVGGPNVSATLQRVDFTPVNIEQLGFIDEIEDALKRRLSSNQGLYLVVGPRRSGRTSSALALASEAARTDAQVIVVSRQSGLATGGALGVTVPRGASMSDAVARAVAQDPDILVIDGLEDAASGQAAAQAAMAGHLVIATAPGRRAIDAPLDLIAAGVPRYLVAATLQLSLAQRLCRQTCSECAVGFELSESDEKALGFSSELAAQAEFKRGQGCAVCWGTGYHGVLPIHEALLINPEMRQQLRDGTSADALLKVARKSGFHTLWEEGVVAAARGLTTPEELRATLMAD